MLREAISSFPKATKFVNLMINVVASFYASSDLDHERLFEEMTKIRHLAFNDLRPNPDSENAPIFRANHSPWPQSAFPASPATLTSEQLQMFINKAQDILLLRHSTDTLAIDHPDSLPIYDMFPEHGEFSCMNRSNNVCTNYQQIESCFLTRKQNHLAI